MNSIVVNNKDKTSVVYEISKLIEAGNDAKFIAEFIEKNNRILSSEEVFNVKLVLPEMPEGVRAMLTPSYKYSINIKLTTIVIIALILDIKFTSGFSSTILAITGKSAQTIRRVEDNHKCVLAEINHKSNCTIDDLDFENKECVWNSITCPFRTDGICKRTKEHIEDYVNILLQTNVIERKNSRLRISF